MKANIPPRGDILESIVVSQRIFLHYPMIFQITQITKAGTH